MKTRNKTSKRNNVPNALPTSARKAGMFIEENPKKPFYIAGIGGLAQTEGQTLYIWKRPVEHPCHEAAS